MEPVYYWDTKKSNQCPRPLGIITASGVPTISPLPVWNYAKNNYSQGYQPFKPTCYFVFVITVFKDQYRLFIIFFMELIISIKLIPKLWTHIHDP